VGQILHDEDPIAQAVPGDARFHSGQHARSA
jgi:hypothetical protein